MVLSLVMPKLLCFIVRGILYVNDVSFADRNNLHDIRTTVVITYEYANEN